MKKRAIWIFDENFLMLTYLSMCSFMEHCDAQISLIYCSPKMKETDSKKFLELSPKVEIIYYDADVSRWETHLQAHILNRLARLHFTRLFEDDLLFMIDSDVAFSSDLKLGIEEIAMYHDNILQDIPMISGVVEFHSAADAYLYFKKKDKYGYTRKTTEESRINSYQSIYGQQWESLVNGFQYNNGFLVFHKARTLIDQWEQYYLTGLELQDINPLDDQVPLSAAIQKTKCSHWKMPNKWNSLGDLDGQFIMFHAWGGKWKIEIDQELQNNKSTSDYGNICSKYLPNCTDEWLAKFNENLLSFPYRYRHILGAFDHGNIFTDLLSQMNEGHIVEVGTYKGRSACFVAELIKTSKKNITFDTIDHFERHDTEIEMVKNNLLRAGVEGYVNVIKAHSINASEFYESNQLDFVFLDTESPIEKLPVELEVWYDKIKPGGILAGYDYSIHDTVFKSYDCVSDSFCVKHNVPNSTYEYQFIIQKPNNPINQEI